MKMRRRIDTLITRLLRLPMSLKLMAIALAMAVALASGLLWQIYSGWRADELAELQDNGRLLAHRLADRSAPLLRQGDFAALDKLLTELSEDFLAVNAIQVRDGGGKLLSRFGPKNPRVPVHEVTTPISGGAGGTISVWMDNSQVSHELASLTRRMLLTIGIIVGTGMAGAWWAARVFTRPIRQLVDKARAVKAGDLGARAPVSRLDEIGELARAFNEMLAEIQQRQALEHQLLRKLISAEDEERKRLARELHDHTGQALAALIAGLSTLNSGPARPEQLSDLLGLATQALSEVHNLSRTLRPVALDELGLVPALQKLCETCSQRLGLHVTCATTGLNGHRQLPQPLEIALYRISQEAITNAARHGKCRSVALLLHRHPNSVLAVIEDDGEGFNAHGWRSRCLQGDHSGLLNIEQRAKLLGGSLRIESRCRGGTSLYVEIPLKLQ